jgi:antitoxin (DNA-binding transcriptional repressor) of toxin-antitoxin stability system
MNVQTERGYDVADAPSLAELVDEVERTGRPCTIRRGDRVVAVLAPPPANQPVARGRRRRVKEPDPESHPMWALVGIGRSGRSDTSERIHDAVAEAVRSHSEPE